LSGAPTSTLFASSGGLIEIHFNWLGGHDDFQEIFLHFDIALVIWCGRSMLSLRH
jgi:hypothetical protein